MSLLQPASKDEYLQPIRDVMDLWLNERSNISFTGKVGRRGGGDVRVDGGGGADRRPSQAWR